MSALNPGVYASILRTKQSYPFDIACLLMRFYGYMMNIGVVSMLTLAGYSFLVAGFVSSLIAISVFVISPRISKLIDERGQSKVLPFAAAATMVGLVSMLVNVSLHSPAWTLFASALPMGFIPNAQAIARTRWAYLLRSGRLGPKPPELRTVFSYEGILDDVAFMFAPAYSIAMATAIAPVAGLLSGGISFVVGIVVLCLSKSTEPTPNWGDREDADKQEPKDKRGRVKSIIRTSSVVRVLFALLFFTGAFYGVFDTAGIALAEELGNANIASIGLVLGAIISMVVGFVFGMIRMNVAQYKQLVCFSALIGIAYGSMMLIDSAPSFIAVSCIAAMFYAPFLIVANATCERAVPGKRLTEAITWINSGMSCGIAIGPTLAGIVIDEFDSIACFDLGGVVALLIPLTVIVCFRVIKRNMRSESYEIVS